MKQTYKSTKNICHITIRTHKDEAYFIYFILESNEGSCYFSTLDESLRKPYRDISIWFPVELSEEMDHVLNALKSHVRLDVLSSEILTDSKS